MRIVIRIIAMFVIKFFMEYFHMQPICRLALTKLADTLQVVGRSKHSSLDSATIRILKEMPGTVFTVKTVWLMQP